MQRKSFADMPCPVARALERVGDWWTILILRESFYGTTRFDEFQQILEIAPNILTARLKQLVQDGLLEKRPYSEKPPRFEYHLTEAGRDFRPVMLALMTWGNKYFAPEGESVTLVNAATGAAIEPVMVNAADGQPVDGTAMTYAAGPAASRALKRRLEVIAQRASTSLKKAS
jgi:DNA-binding HxlR family transcriptional regulator